MKTLTQQQLHHLYWRAGFGPSFQENQKALSVKEAVHDLLKASARFKPLNISMAGVEVTPAMLKNQDARKRIQQKRRESFVQMNYAWLSRMAESPQQLQEKMTLFWHGHFACRLRDPRLALLQHNTLRKHALGNFKEMLIAISKDPGMLQFLNNQQNRKEQPNENFARELLELFTLGHGYYTEQDIKEAARAFTGWSFNLKGEFVFRERLHDRSKKTFMGQTGYFTGEDILKIILDKPRTAQFLAEKMYKYFVSDTPNPAHVQQLGDVFYNNGYDIASTLKHLFTADWFYAPELMGVKIKSPVELLAGLQRQFAVNYADERAPVIIQRVLGQELFLPPNVSGWAGGRAWIDSSTLAYRLRIGPALIQNTQLEVALRSDNDAEPSSLNRRQREALKLMKAEVSLTSLQRRIKEVQSSKLATALSHDLLQVQLTDEQLNLIVQHSPRTGDLQQRLRITTLWVLSLPEYQLC